MRRTAGEVAKLLSGGIRDGAYPAEALEPLARTGAAGEIAESLGSTAHGSEVLLVTALADDSGSIGESADAVCRGQNRLLQALGEAGGSADVLVHTRYLNGGMLAPYEPLARATRMSRRNYAADAWQTPLYRESIVTLGTVLAKTREAEASGQRARTYTLLVTDGEDNASGEASASDVAGIVRTMISSRRHIVAGMGIGEDADFEEVFCEMGIPAHLILTASSSPEDIAATFRTVADSLALAAASEAAFLELTIGPKAAS